MCVIPVQTLLAVPFNLATGVGVYAKIIAYNSIGDSIFSSVGNGAIVKLSLVPSPPSLSQNKILSTKT